MFPAISDIAVIQQEEIAIGPNMDIEHTILYIIIYERMYESIERLQFVIFIRGIPADIPKVPVFSLSLIRCV